MRRSLAALSVAILLAACTGSKGSEDEAPDGSWSPVAPAAAPAPSTTQPKPTPDTTPEPPANMAELEAAWAEQRKVVIDRIEAEGFGRGPDGIITGAGGFTVDTTACPEEWSDTEGVGDTIVIG